MRGADAGGEGSAGDPGERAASFEALGGETVYEGRIVDVRIEGFRHADGEEVTREIVRHGGAVAIVAYDEEQVWLVRQPREAVSEPALLEIPAGRLDKPGELPLQAAKRELVEETGYRARKWKKLVSFYASPGFVAEKMTIFLATDLTEGQAQPMEDERIECRWFSPAEIDSMLQSGKIIDGKTMIGFLTWKRFS